MGDSNTQVRLSVSLTPDQKRAIDEIAEKSQVSVARVIRQAITEFLADRSDPKLPLFDTRLTVVDEESLKD